MEWVDDVVNSRFNPMARPANSRTATIFDQMTSSEKKGENIEKEQLLKENNQQNMEEEDAGIEGEIYDVYEGVETDRLELEAVQDMKEKIEEEKINQESAHVLVNNLSTMDPENHENHIEDHEETHGNNEFSTESPFNWNGMVL